jgi:holliday junction DNA helicase RuvA
MIGSLRGELLDRTLSGEVLVEVGGVGYRVVVSPSTAIAVGDIGQQVFLHVHHHIREDAQTLYGFTSRDERISFEALLSAHGVGPALALAILSVHPPASLSRVLADDDLAALCLVPGVGKKTTRPRRPRRVVSRRAATSTRRWLGSGTGPKRSATQSATCRRTGTPPSC